MIYILIYLVAVAIFAVILDAGYKSMTAGPEIKTPATAIKAVAPGIPTYQKAIFALLPLIPLTIIITARIG